jgi:ubiquinone/menaquinone biosynthesis C-methylase UbiE
MQRLAKKYPQGNFLELDASTIATDSKFDSIYSNKVLHHLTDGEIKTSIENQARVLYEKGIICHSFWKGDGDEVFKGLFVNYHTKEGVKKIFSNDFEILILEEYQEFDPNDSLFLIARKK